MFSLGKHSVYSVNYDDQLQLNTSKLNYDAMNAKQWHGGKECLMDIKV